MRPSMSSTISPMLAMCDVASLEAFSFSWFASVFVGACVHARARDLERASTEEKGGGASSAEGVESAWARYVCVMLSLQAYIVAEYFPMRTWDLVRLPQRSLLLACAAQDESKDSITVHEIGVGFGRTGGGRGRRGSEKCT